MILTIVIPKIQKAQFAQIDEEFKFIDYELIIQKDIVKATKESKGRFILFLEENSAFNKGQLNNSLDVFRFNDSYRKLAMVCSTVDFDNIQEPRSFTYNDGIKFAGTHGDTQYPVKIGYLYGSIIRATAMRKVVEILKKDAIHKSIQLSDFFWSNGLRIELNPKAVYYAPADYSPELNSYKIKKDAESLKVWKNESIV